MKECGSKTVRIYYDDLLENLPEKMKFICSELNIKYSKNLTDLEGLPEKLHQVGGNFRVNRDFLQKLIRLDDRCKKVLTKEEINLIDNSIANEVFVEKLYKN